MGGNVHEWSKNVAGSRGSDFVGNSFVALQCKKTDRYFFKHSWGCKIMGKGNQQILGLLPHPPPIMKSLSVLITYLFIGMSMYILSEHKCIN